MKTKTFGEIAKSHGFDNINDYMDAVNKEVDIVKSKSFNVGDAVKLKTNYRPTHFKTEEILPLNTKFVVSEKGHFTLDQYYIKLEGFDDWFSASVFESNKN